VFGHELDLGAPELSGRRPFSLELRGRLAMFFNRVVVTRGRLSESSCHEVPVFGSTMEISLFALATPRGCFREDLEHMGSRL
jgi:hypothetical protein